MNLVISLVVSTIAVFVTGYVLPGVEIDTFFTACIVAIVLGTLNLFVRPFISILTLPITVLTFGLFSFVINALMVLIADFFIEGLVVDSFLWALAFSLVVSLVASFLNSLLNSKD
ncbi:MAG TPA: phage holin family protein [Candidatus Levybacteria bacterium]|nr:phage holin family protein [Candidatus Levybacteria bacterium]